MRIGILLILISIFPLSYGQTNKNSTIKVVPSFSTNEDIPIYNFNTLEPLLYTKSDKTFIVNFWAMWCAPCVKELPIIQEYKRNNPNVEVLLVSLDFPEDIETKLKPFLKQKRITSKVVLLDDPNANSWIDKIDPNWSGAIPFTIIFNNQNRSYHERSFKDVPDLENEIVKTIKNKKHEKTHFIINNYFPGK